MNWKLQNRPPVEEEKTTLRRKRDKALVHLGPNPSPSSAHKQKWEKCSGEEINTRVSGTSGPEDLLQEESWHRALRINRDGPQREPEHCVGPRHLLLAEDQRTVSPSEIHHRGGCLKDMPAVGSVPEGEGLEGALSGRERADGCQCPCPPSSSCPDSRGSKLWNSPPAWLAQRWHSRVSTPPNTLTLAAALHCQWRERGWIHPQ